MKKILFLLYSLFLLSCTEDPEILTGEIMGVVTAAEDGGREPLAGVRVNLLSSGKSVSTGSDGKFYFHELEPGAYQLQFAKEGYKSDTRNVRVTAAEVTACDIQLQLEKRDVVSITPSSLDFGSNVTQLSTVITNNGSRDLEWNLDLGGNILWLSASPISGRLASGKTQTIVFTVDRDRITSQKSAVVNLKAGGSSFPISIAASFRDHKSKMVFNPQSLNFGTESFEEKLQIKNVGDATLNWTLKSCGDNVLSVSEEKGSIAVDGSKYLIVTLDRSQMVKDLSTQLVFSDGVNEEAVSVMATYVAKKGKLEVTPGVLDFEGDKTELPLNIKNSGNSEVSWSISNIKPELTVSSASGSLKPGANTVVRVSLNRKNMPDNLNTSFVVSDGTNKQAVLVKAYVAKAQMVVSPKSLDFGNDVNALTFFVYNEGTADLAWNVKNVSSEAISLSAKNGRLSPKGQVEVTVYLDRAKMNGTLNETLTVTDGKNEEVVNILAEKDYGGELVVPDGLYGYFRFDGNLEDASGSNIYAYPMGESVFVDGLNRGGKALKLSRDNDNSVIVNEPLLDVKEKTISFWGKDFPDGNIFIVEGNDREYYHNLYIANGKLVYTNACDFYDQLIPFVHPRLNDNKWHHVVLVCKAGDLVLYLDGHKVDEHSVHWNNNEYIDTGGKLRIGGYGKNKTTGANMPIDNFRVYDTRILSEEEIQMIYHAKQ